MSSGTLSNDGSSVHSYDFTANIAASVGRGTKDKSGKTVMVSGDADYDGNIGLSDLNDEVLTHTGRQSYLRSDVNYDTNTGLADYNEAIQVNIGKTSQVPES